MKYERIVKRLLPYLGCRPGVVWGSASVLEVFSCVESLLLDRRRTRRGGGRRPLGEIARLSGTSLGGNFESACYAKRPKTTEASVPRKVSPSVGELVIDCAHGYVQWGFMWRITPGIRLGILLEPHPLWSAKLQVGRPVGGSAGIPDSLGHKSVNTSGGWWLDFDPVAPGALPVILIAGHPSSIISDDLHCYSFDYLRIADS